MSTEIYRPYQERIVTVVGGKGPLGSKVATGLEPLGFQSVQVCEKGDPFLDFVNRSTDLFFAVDNTEITSMLQASREYLNGKEDLRIELTRENEDSNWKSPADCYILVARRTESQVDSHP